MYGAVESLCNEWSNLLFDEGAREKPILVTDLFRREAYTRNKALAWSITCSTLACVNLNAAIQKC